MAQLHLHQLQLTEEQHQTLRHQHAILSAALEENYLLKSEFVAALGGNARDILLSQPGLDFARLFDDGQVNHHILQLSHPDHEVLNLPWHLAASGADKLYITKGLPDHKALPDFAPDNPLPLKILIMVASPENAGVKSRLSFEEEELSIVQALAPLIKKGEVEVDFTEDGSLEALHRKLRDNRYHALHFSGHSSFDEVDKKDVQTQDKEGFLLMEEELSMNARFVSALEFAGALNEYEQNRPALVLLSSCQSAQGSAREGFRGVANRLMQAGIPASIAMGWSVTDVWATLFVTEFYKQLTDKQMLPRAFHLALKKSSQLPPEPEFPQAFYASQSLIPQLYFSQKTEQLVNWQSARKESLEYRAIRFLEGENSLRAKLQKTHLFAGKREKGYLFIGRRRERKEILRLLAEGKPVLLRGQGGIGKTALAEHVVQRLLAGDPDRVQPFVFDETNLSLESVNNTLLNFLDDEKGQRTLRTEIAAESDTWKNFLKLFQKTEEYCRPVFVFDNMESFQVEKGGAFERDEIRELLQYLTTNKKMPVLLTGRYLLPELPNVTTYPLNQANFNDFYKKCLYLEIKALKVEGKTFEDTARLLAQSFGGNYRALEFFDELYREKKQAIFPTLEKLEEYIREEKYRKPDETEEKSTLQRMSENLVFSQLLALLEPDALRALLLLAQFRRPVLPLALEYQDAALRDVPQLLDRLSQLTLAEKRRDAAQNLDYYYAPTLVQELLKAEEQVAADFSHDLAGGYFEYMVENLGRQAADLEEAFHHYCQAMNVEKVNDTGDTLSTFYYGRAMFQMAFYFALQTYETIGGLTSMWIFNRLGQIFNIFGKYDEALIFLHKGLEGAKKRGNRKGEGVTLNNISQIHDAKGEYDIALRYLQRSLEIRQEVGDRHGEGATLSNIGLNYKRKGDYQKALHSYEQSLKIMQEIGDRRGESVALNNLSRVFSDLGDYDKALEYSKMDLKICQEIGDRAGEGTTLNNIGLSYQNKGDHEMALHYFQQSLKIQQEIGDRKGEAAALNNLATTAHAKGDYDMALKYLKQSLKICQGIGDRAGMLSTLHNIAHIALQKGDAQQYIESESAAWQLANEIGDAYGIFMIGKEFGATLCRSGFVEQGLPMLQRAYEVGQQSGLAGTERVEALVAQYSGGG